MVATAPVIEPAAAAPEHRIAKVAAVRHAAPAPAKPLASGTWFVQLGAYENAAVAKDGWGRAVRRFAAFEPGRLTVVATRARGGDDLVDRVHGIDEVHALLPGHDVVVLVVPHTDATHHLVDAGFLAAMRDGALLVNVARGKVVDTDALLAACAAGHVRAALDVTDPEPLPAEDPLWDAPNIIITPHGAGGRPVGASERIAHNLRALDGDGELLQRA